MLSDNSSCLSFFRKENTNEKQGSKQKKEKKEENLVHFKYQDTNMRTFSKFACQKAVFYLKKREPAVTSSVADDTVSISWGSHFCPYSSLLGPFLGSSTF